MTVGGSIVTIYIDVLFLINSLCSVVLLQSAGMLSGIRCSIWRSVLGAVGMSLLYCVLLLFGVGFQGGWFLSTILSSIGVLLAFMPKSLRQFFSLMVSCAVASFLLAGFMTALYAFTGFQRLLGQGLAVEIQWMKWQSLLWGCLMFWLLFKHGIGFLDRCGRKRKEYCYIQIEYHGKTGHLRGFWDNGNALHDTDGNPLAVAELGACLSFLEKDCALQLLTTGKPTEEEQQAWMEIPFSALGVEQGTLYAVQVDAMRILGRKETKVLSKIWIGLYVGHFAGAYDILLPPALLEEGKR